jgi:hypothetical protein
MIYEQQLLLQPLPSCVGFDAFPDIDELIEWSCASGEISGVVLVAHGLGMLAFLLSSRSPNVVC